MANEALRTVLQHLRRVADLQGPDRPSDAELLERFAVARDQTAFEVLVWRHGPMVLNLCRRMLRHEYDAEDAFQATFLMLVRKAGSIAKREAVGSWLYKVAYRVALLGNARRAKRAARESAGVETVAAKPAPDPAERELQLALSEEVNRLPDKYRVPLVLCCFEGKTNQEVAKQLRCAEATVRTRLARARERLRMRLTERGLALSVGILAAELTPHLLPAVPVALVDLTVKAATQFAVGKASAVGVVSANAAVLAERALKLMFLNKLKQVAVMAILVGVFGSGAGLSLRQVLAEKPAAQQKEKTPKPLVQKTSQSDGAAGVESTAEWTYPVTYRGKPVAGAKVALIPFTDRIPGETKAGEPIFTTADDKGEARFPRPAGLSFPYARLLARDATGHGGYGTLFGDDARFPPTIELLDNTELTGRVTDASGKAIAGLTLKLAALGPESFARFNGRPTAFAETPDWFWTAFPPKLAADGSFAVRGVPAGHSVAVRFEAVGFGAGRFWVIPGKPALVTLQESGALRLHFSFPPDTKPKDIRATATRTGTADTIEAKAEGTAKAGADLTLADLPPGEYRIAFPYAGPALVFPKAVGTVTMKAGRTEEVAIPLEPAAHITARLIDSKTGKGVAGAKLTTNITRGLGDSVSVRDTQANADGRIDLLVPAGMVQLSPGTAAGYAVIPPFSTNPFNNDSTEPVPVAPGKVHDFGAFTLVKTVDFAGVVIDDTDKPVAGAKVFVGYSGRNFYRGKAILSDANGRFMIRGMSPAGGVFGVTARKADAITAVPVAVDPAKPEGTIRLVISPKFAAKVRVRAVDRGGKPIANASVELGQMGTYLANVGPAAGFGTSMKVGATVMDGWFVSDILQPGDRYQVTLSALGYRSATSPDWIGVPGAMQNFGDLTLIRADLAVSGTVTDPAGKPVAGATVFDNADGPHSAAATTDTAGHFLLGGLYEGPAFVSVRAKGFRLASVPAQAGGPALAVLLRRLSDPPAPPPVISEAHRAATAKLTRHQLETLWANRLAANDDGKWIIRAMAQFDPATARKWRDEEKIRSGGKVDLSAEIEAADRDRTLLTTARDDPDEAIALLKDLGGREGFRAVCQLARQLLPDAPDKALRIAEEAVVRARAMPEADRPLSLAQAGEMVFATGKKDAGRMLIEEAVKLAEAFEVSRRGIVACRLALFDPARARALIDPIPDAVQFNRCLALACARAAEIDLPLAKQWQTEFRPGDNTFTRYNTGQWIAYRLVRAHPDEAIVVAKAIADPTTRAGTLAGLAYRLQDKARAVKLIDAAMDHILANPAGYYNWGAAATAAVLLYRAKQIGHPDLAALRDKVLAVRTPPRTGPFEGANGPQVAEALALALTDPETARMLLPHKLSPKDPALVELGRREPLIALALTDPAALTPAVDKLVAAAVKRQSGFQNTSLHALALVLAQPDHVLDNAIRRTGRFADIEEE
jgi:RNA polymerase sigma factor (sigma-70 family)